MKVDAHMHVDFNNLKSVDIINYLDENHIDECWLLSWEENKSKNPEYQHLSIENIFSVYEQYPKRFIPFYAPDPTDRHFEEKLNKWYKKGIKGIGELKVNLKWNSPYIETMLECAHNLKLPVLFHMDEGKIIYKKLKHSYSEEILNRFLNSNKLNYFLRRLLLKVSEINSSLSL